MDYCYVLFVRTGDEELIRQFISDRLDAGLYLPFVPKKAMMFKRRDVMTKVYRTCFPGYVFIQSVYPPSEFLDAMFPIIYPIREAYRFLHYGDNRSDVALREHERLALLNLFDENFSIECLVGVMEGDRVQIISGSFIGTEGRVKRVVLRKREVVVEIPFLGGIKPLTLGLDIVDKV